MTVELRIDLNHPDLGKGHVRIEAEGYPTDLFVPMALSHLGKDDKRMADMLQQILSSESAAAAYDEDDDEPKDENR